MTRKRSAVLTAILIGLFTFTASARTGLADRIAIDSIGSPQSTILESIEVNGQLARAIRNSDGKINGFRFENGSKILFKDAFGVQNSNSSITGSVVCSGNGAGFYLPVGSARHAVDLAACLAAIREAGEASYEAYRACKENGLKSWTCNFSTARATAMIGVAVYICSDELTISETIDRIDKDTDRRRDEAPCDSGNSFTEMDYLDGKSLGSDSFSINCGAFDY